MERLLGRAGMERSVVTRRLREHAPELRRAGVASLCMFGSTARGQAKPDSDVDLFFEYDDPRFSLVELVRVKRRIAEILGVDADLMTRDSLHPLLREQIEASAVRVF
jgi:predicted nucleotidyltransferase